MERINSNEYGKYQFPLLNSMHTARKKYNYIEIAFLFGVQILLQLTFAKKLDYIFSLDKVQHLLRLALPTDDDKNFISNGRYNLNKWKKEHKIFTTFYLTGNAKANNKCLDVVQSETRKIKYTCDTMNIIKVHFRSENTYGQFVYLNNMMIEEGIKRYMFYKDDFYIIGNGQLNSPEIPSEIESHPKSSAHPLIIY